ncbi:MAG: NlpC/P60 family protein [Patiriisocius sp.]|uniref:NlpC/P60 family protein n=1 Tax=Patiriisocius sp. TaxID=2822396 RepID=UPI003EF90967
MKTLLLLFGLLLFSEIGFAQTFDGTIIDEESNTAISNAFVKIDGTSISAVTGLDGKFSIDDELPRGEQVVIVVKDGYEDKFFLIDVTPGKIVSANKVGLEMTKDEMKRRKKLRKAQEKEEKQRLKDEEARLKEVKKNREKEEKRLAKELKKAKKSGKNVDVDYDNVIESEPEIMVEPDEPLKTSDVETVLPIQIKYGAIIGKTPQEITNIELYTFIDDWMGTPYKMGGANTDGIDCSSFAQRLFTAVYGMYIERTAQKQFDSKYTDKFKGKEYLREGDLLFFGPSEYEITHVGIYLANNMFVNATSRRGKTGTSGVKISNLAESYWTNLFQAGGRRPVKND